jgi:type IV pilus assembly protein PilO
MTLDVRRVPARHRPAALLLAIAVAVATDWWCLAGARAVALGTAREQLTRQRIELATARREVASRGDTKQAVRAAARALRHAALRLPDRRELAALLADVARSAREARLDLVLLRPKAERATADHVEVPVELQVRGGYLQTLGFLDRLERLSRLVHVGDLKLERQERTGERVVLRTSCTAVTYRLLDPQDGRAPGHAGAGGTPPE